MRKVDVFVMHETGLDSEEMKRRELAACRSTRDRISRSAFGLNERGDIVGVYEDENGLHGFLWTHGD